MKILIIEDEPGAARRLERNITKALPQAKILATLESVVESVDWLTNQETPDLIFMDIHLTDGASFDIFDAVEVSAPIIFTTAYDEYALQAFKTNSIDYLLKPIRYEELETAIQKWRKLQEKGPSLSQNLDELRSLVQGEQQSYQQRILIRAHQKLLALEVSDIGYFYLESRIVFAQLKSGKKYPIDFNLDQLEERLDPGHFFRINRQFIVTFEAIQNMIPYSKSRLKLDLSPNCHLESIVATERASKFKRWLTGELQT